MLGIWLSGWSPVTLAMTALAGLLGGYYWVWSRSRFVRLICAIPGPKTVPLLGNILDLVNNFYDLNVFAEWIKKNNYTFPIWFGYSPIIHVAHHDALEPILSNQSLLTKPDFYRFIFLESSLGVLADEQWRHRRRLLTPAFHFKILEEFMYAFNEESMATAARMEQILGPAGCKEIDVLSFMSKFAFDVLYVTSIGKNTWSEEDKKRCAEAVEGMENIFMQRTIHQPWLSIDWIFKMTSLYRKQKQYVSFGTAFNQKVIQERREFRRRNADKYSRQSVFNNNDEEDQLSRPKERLALLDLLLKASEENPDFDDKAISGEISLFVAAGMDTTSSTLTLLLYLLAKHPEIQKLVMEELDLVFDDSDRPVTSQDLTELKYLECCIKETLRLYPALPTVARCLTEEVKIGDYTLPKGVLVFLDFYITHRNPEVFPDPEAFKPERFLPENSVGRHPYAFIPFSAGPRNCIGQKFAMMVMKVSLANILRRLRFSLSDTSGPLLLPQFKLSLKPSYDQCHLIVSKK